MPPTLIHRAFTPELRETDLPAGVIGQVAGIAVVYEVVDDYGTMFARGSLDRTTRERVAAGKVKLFWDHGDAHTDGFYDSDLHIGTVRSLTDVRMADGQWGAYMVADLLDTPKAREVQRYLKSVLASGGDTGLSVGGLVKGIRSETVRVNGHSVERFTEFALREISVTSMQAVPDSHVLAVRADPSTETESEPDPLADAARRLTDLLATAPDATRSELATVLALVQAAQQEEAAAESETETDQTMMSAPPRNLRTAKEAALDLLLTDLGPTMVRARLEATGLWDALPGNATTEDSSAAGPTPAASDAEAEDSRTAPAVMFSTMEDRQLALRHSYRM
jgi:HK97 family phage prohead protease